MYFSIVIYAIATMTTGVYSAESTNDAVKNYTLTEDVGHISSPNWNTGNYPDNSNIWWKIVATKGQTIKLKFETLVVNNPFGRCGKDYIEVYTDPRHGFLHGTYCSENMPPKDEIQSVENELFVHFVSDGFFRDGTDEKRGFEASYQVLNKDGKPVATLAPPTDSDDYDDYEDYGNYEDESTTSAPVPKTSSTTQSTTTESTTTTTTTSTIVQSTTTMPPIKSTTTSPKTVLITKISTAVNEGRKTRLLTLPVILGVAVLAFIVMVACAVMYLRWRKKNSTRFISLRQNSDEDFGVDDRKHLVNDSEPTIYKKQNGSQFSSVPQQDSFPL